jgi:putative mycofactocin binding protein MftB
VTDEAESGARSFDAQRPWKLDPQVALRDEAFGALAYHYGTRRLVFLKSRHLVDVVRGLDSASSASAAIAAVVDPDEVTTYEAALSRLAASEIIHAA